MSIALKQVFNKDKTFRPKRKFEPGTQRFELHKRAQASLNSGVDLKAAVQLPSGEDQNDWVAVHVVDFFNRINLIYGTICEFCTERTCPVMSGGPKYEYRWQDDMKYKKPTALPAPQYMNLLMDWIEVQINNEDMFPTSVGVPFPKNFLQICKKILCRLFRVFVHVYIHHFDRIILMGAEAHVNTCYKHFYYFVTELNLIDRKELEPLVILMESVNAPRPHPRDKCDSSGQVLKKICVHVPFVSMSKFSTTKGAEEKSSHKEQSVEYRFGPHYLMSPTESYSEEPPLDGMEYYCNLHSSDPGDKFMDVYEDVSEMSENADLLQKNTPPETCQEDFKANVMLAVSCTTLVCTLLFLIFSCTAFITYRREKGFSREQQRPASASYFDPLKEVPDSSVSRAAESSLWGEKTAPDIQKNGESKKPETSYIISSTIDIPPIYHASGLTGSLSDEDLN
ncbi:uncharacterized protein FYW35_012109 [Pterocles gutturalis]